MTQSLFLVDAPDPVVSLADAKAFLHVWHDDDNALITHLIAAATDKLDGAHGVLGRALGEQTWDYVLDGFPCGAGPKGGGIRIPLPPLQSVVSVKYIDRHTGTEVTLAEGADYEVDPYGQPGWVVPSSRGWPSTMDTINGVRIRFKAGYDEVPASLKQVILGLVFFWYGQRGAAASPNSATAEMPFGFDDVVVAWQVPFVG